MSKATPNHFDLCTSILVISMIAAWPVIILAWLGWLPESLRRVMSITAGIVFLINVPLLVRDIWRAKR